MREEEEPRAGCSHQAEPDPPPAAPAPALPRHRCLPPPALLLAALAVLSGARSEGNVFLTEPSSAPYFQRAGDQNVLLQCSVREEFASGLQWLSVSGNSKLPRIISLMKEVKDPGHYELDTDGSVGTYNLRIKEVEFGKDNANFFCQVDNPNGEPLTSRRAQVIVLVKPERPVISEHTRLPVRQGGLAYAECASGGGNPPPRVSWLFPNGSLADEAFVRTVNGSLDSETRSTLRWPVSPGDDGGSVTCRVWNEAMGPDAEPLSISSPPFAVQYAPIVSLGEAETQPLEEGTRASLRCQAKGNPAVFTYEWLHSLKGALPGADSDTYEFEVSREDAGHITCRVRNAIGAGDDTLELDVLYKPHITVQPVYTVAKGDSLMLQCDVDANPPPDKISWQGPDGRFFEGSTVDLRSISRKDAGNYTCEAINTLPLGKGPGTRVGQGLTQLKVLYAPGRAIVTVAEEPTLVGSRVTLYCTAEEPGEPPAEFYWKAPNQPDYSPLNPRNTYTIEVASLANAGDYWCRPQNQLGPNKIGEGAPGFYTLKVIQPAQLDRPLPSQPLELTANKTADAISCQASGNPAPIVTWLKDGEPISNQAGESLVPSRWALEAEELGGDCPEPARCSYRITSSLRWAGPVHWSDKGAYTCRASNGAGAAPESSLLVRVRHQPHIDAHRSRTQAGADVGKTAHIRCRTSANPRPTFRWRFQGGESGDIQEGGRYSFQVDESGTDTVVHTLNILSVRESDFGAYVCQASNMYGTAIQPFDLLRTRKPETPSGLRVVESGYSWLRLGWEPGFDGGNPQTFTLALTPLNPLTKEKDGRPMTFEVAMKGSSRLGNRFKRYVNDVFETLIKYNATDLMPLRKYAFKVLSTTSKGESGWSQESSGQTKEPLVDRAMIKVESAIYNAATGSLTFKPSVPGGALCLLVVLESAERRGDWAAADCRPTASESLESLPTGAAQARVTFCRREDGACSPMVEALHAKATGVGGIDWGTVAPIVAVVVLLVLLALIAGLCCCVRNRQAAAKPKRPVSTNLRADYEMEASSNAARPKAISGPFGLQDGGGDGSLEKVPVESGSGSSGANTGLSNGDSGVFTVGSVAAAGYGYKPEEVGGLKGVGEYPVGYHNAGYGGQPASDADRWASAALDPFDSQDPYAGSYGLDYGDGSVEGLGPAGPGYYDPYGNPAAMVDLNPQGTQPAGSAEEGSINSGYSTPNQRRVMREIIV